MELELEAGESSVYSGQQVVTLPPELPAPPSRLRVRAKLPSGQFVDVQVPSDAMAGQILPLQSDGAGWGAAAQPQTLEDRLNAEEEERRRRIEERSFNTEDLGLDDIMNTALGPQGSSPPPAPAPAPAPQPALRAGGDDAASEDVPEETGKRYTCLRRSIVRAAVATDSDRLGTLEVGEEVVVLEGRRLTDTGAVRVRSERGWTSLVSSAGQPILGEATSAGGAEDAAAASESARLSRLAQQEAPAPAPVARPVTPPSPMAVAPIDPMADAWDSGAAGGGGGGWGADDDDEIYGGSAGAGGTGSTPSLASMMQSSAGGANDDKDGDDDLDDIMARFGVGGS